jgi:hypothetical protein
MGQSVAAGPSNSVVIDKQGMYWMAGKVCHRVLAPIHTSRSHTRAVEEYGRR